MNIERLTKILLMDLTSDNLKLEDELEKTINSDLEINHKISEIKRLLTKINETEANISKYRNMINFDKNNDNKKEEQNGTN